MPTENVPKLVLINPQNEASVAESSLAPRLSGLQGKRVGMIAHQESVQALGMGTNSRGIPIYKVRGKSKLGGKTIEGYVSAFYIEKDNKAVAEHKFEWVDEDDWELHGISKEDHE